jgi:hypothetical protein
MPLPKLLRLRQRFDRPRVDDIPAAVQQTLDALDLPKTIRPGQTVAVTAGSRGIANIALILREVVAFLRRIGAQPYLVPAMGSHGGGTPEGQLQILTSYGITPDYIGAELRASMDVVSLGATAEGFPLWLDKHASQADHIAVVGRVKPHTAYHGPIESGLLKMMMIGLGKHAGASHYHRVLLEHPFDKVIRSVGGMMLQRARIAFGVGIVENAYDETALIEGVRPADFVAREEHLLRLARQWLAKLPWAAADLLIVDEIGKDISGSGMDTNVVGRKRAFRDQPTSDQPQMHHIFVRGLTAKTHGNATGIGLADFTTTRLVKAMDYRATVINCVTAGYPVGANVPVHFETDQEVVETSLSIIGSRLPEQARVMRIRNTLAVEEVEVSEACFDTGPPQTEHERIGAAAASFAFGPDGNLHDP